MVSLCGRGFDSHQVHHHLRQQPASYIRMQAVAFYYPFPGQIRGRALPARLAAIEAPRTHSALPLHYEVGAYVTSSCLPASQC